MKTSRAGEFGIQLCMALVMLSASIGAIAQAYPNRPISLIVPFGSGTGADVTARAVTAEASSILGQPIVYENRAGANGKLGIIAMQNAKPDGYLISIALDGTLIQQSLADPALRVEMDKDYVPVALLFEGTFILASRSSLPFRDVKGFVTYVKNNPGKINFAVTQGFADYFVAEMIKQALDLDFTFVPYKSQSVAVPDLLSGRVDMIVSSTSIKQYVDAGKLVGLASTGRERWAPFPSLPTFKELGIPVVGGNWFSVVAAPGTPRDIVLKLNRAFNDAVRTANIQKIYADYGYVVQPNLSPEDFGQFIKAGIKTWEPIIRKLSIKPQ